MYFIYFSLSRDSEEYCTVRHFSITGRKVVNRGDSFKAKRSSSGNSVVSLGSSGYANDLISKLINIDKLLLFVMTVRINKVMICLLE